MLTNSYRSFEISCVIETGLSGFHNMTVSVMERYFQKQKSKIISYRYTKNFLQSEYRQQIPFQVMYGEQYFLNLS